MNKATIHVLEDNSETNVKEIPVMFNPTEYKNAMSATWTDNDCDMPQFDGSKIDDFSVTLLFDTYELGEDVREDSSGSEKKRYGTNLLAKLAIPSVALTDGKRPPIILFSWGQFNYKGVISKIDQNFTIFLSTGIPARAKVTITMKAVMDRKEMLKLKGAEACRKIHIIKSGERLDIIAAQKMNNAELWPMIAKLNNISDPMAFPTPDMIGKQLIIPDTV